jgi:rhamnulose-1-phosphate aldolase/alcohol dehydrogenase
MSKGQKQLSHVKYLWRDDEAGELRGLDRLVYRSNKLGEDLTLTNTGGGNTSSKLMETDPLTGEEVEILWVKGSGGDLRTAKRDGFASLYLNKVRAMKSRYLADPQRGPKTAVEEKMYPMYSHCVFGLNPRACSIDTPLHTFVPYRHVDHLHPNAVIAIAASVKQERLCREVYGSDVIYVPWQRPGFDIGLLIESLIKENPKAKGVLFGHHGMSSWSNDEKDCYETALEIIDRATRYIEQHHRGEQTFGGQKYKPLAEDRRREVLNQIVPFVRGLVSATARVVGTVQDDERTLRFVNSQDGPRLAALGTSCPDHFLRTKIKPLFVEWNPESEDLESLKASVADGLRQYRIEYANYYRKYRRPDSPPMRDPNPTVVLIPGLGMVAWGKNKSESRVTAEFYNCAIEVMRGAEAIDRYEAMDPQEAFDIEYWSLEEAKLQRLPPEKEFERQIITVIGAGSGIGKAVAHHLAREGGHIVCVDIDEAAAKRTAREITDKYGEGIGIGGTGPSSCGPAIGLSCDITNRRSIQEMFASVVFSFGGLDALAITAGIFMPSAQTREDADLQWSKAFAVNVTGAHTVADEAYTIFTLQNLSAAIVVTTSANAVVAKKGSLAYDTSKAAANHLVRELAVEMAPLVRVNAVAPATVIRGSTMFPRDRLKTSLGKYGIPFGAEDTTDELRHKLGSFYAKRSLLGAPIEPEDQAEAVYILLSPRLSKTTGHIIPVDGGLQDGFLR